MSLYPIIDGNQTAPRLEGFAENLMDLIDSYGDVRDPKFAASVAAALMPCIMTIEAVHQRKRLDDALVLGIWRRVYAKLADEIRKA